jgi:polyribonucleotide 5'-hydroxyl-kinase
MISILSKQVHSRLEKDVDAKSSGIIVNTCGWIDGAGYDVIVQIIKEFHIDVVLVMNNDKLYSTLMSSSNEIFSSLPNNSKPVVVKLPSSGGVVHRVSCFFVLEIVSNPCF